MQKKEARYTFAPRRARRRPMRTTPARTAPAGAAQGAASCREVTVPSRFQVATKSAAITGPMITPLGPKLAMRIVNELKDRTGGAVPVAGGLPVAPVVGAAADAVSALLNLGFRPAEASAAVAKADEELGTGASLDMLVRVALKKAAR